jgi:hypothetical protein
VSSFKLDMFSHFDRLFGDLPLIRAKVAAIDSPNSEFDRPVKFAFVGYLYHQSAECWGRQEFDFVAGRRNEVVDCDPLWVEFVCLGVGYCLAAFQTARFNQVEFKVFEAQLAGYMWLHSERFTST